MRWSGPTRVASSATRIFAAIAVLHPRPRVLERHRAVEHRRAGRGVGIDAEVAEPLELERASPGCAPRRATARPCSRVNDFERRGVELRQEVRRRPRRASRREQPIVEAHFGVDARARRHPVQRRLDLAAVRRVAAARRRIVRAAQLDDSPASSLTTPLAGDEVRVAQAHFAARREAEEFLRRILAEVVLLDVEHARERHLARAGRRDPPDC